jgi:thioredoxin reductase
MQLRDRRRETAGDGELAVTRFTTFRGRNRWAKNVTPDVTIIGAGPYGLSLAAHLEAKGISFRIIGVPMEFWKRSMPAGMSLKSDGCASSIYDPSRTLTLGRFCAEENIPYADLGLPVTLETFISYGLAFQQRMVPAVEQRVVTSVGAHQEGFTLRLDNGEEFTTHKVVVAVGVGYFAHMPEELSGLTDSFVTHSSRHSDLAAFENRDVAIVGAGASALDLAALLKSAGSRPVVVSRGPRVQFHDRQRLPRKMRDRLRAPSSGIGPGWYSWFFCNAPLVFHYLPLSWRLQKTKTHAGPAGGWFIKDSVVGKVPILVNVNVQAATTESDRVHIRLSSDVAQTSNVTVDHVIAATGYRVDVDRITFLEESLQARIETVNNTPILSSHFESSVPGLYFVGPVAANSFGPVQRFAVGARFAARRVTRGLAGATFRK